jgi:hypothetical protein
LLALNNQLLHEHVDGDLLKVGSAIEISHQASLIVDDETDEDEVRADDRIALHARYGHGTASTISHLLISSAENNILSSSFDATKKVALCSLLVRTKMEMAIGQCADVFLSEKPTHISWVDWCLQHSYLKTKSLMALPFNGTAIMRELETDKAAQMQACGYALGAAYQVGDDMRDVEVKEGPLTLSLPLAVVLDRPGLSNQNFLNQIIRKRRLDSHSASQLQQILLHEMPEIKKVAAEVVATHASIAERIPQEIGGKDEVADMTKLIRTLVS